jgi:chromosome segregation ATPase
MHAKLAHEVQDLEAKHAGREATIVATKARYLREKSRWRAAEGQQEEVKKELNEQEGKLTESPTKQEDNEDQDWKGMLFKQERKTEHFKLNYIKLKNARKNSEAEYERHVKALEAKLSQARMDLKARLSSHRKAIKEEKKEKSRLLGEYKKLKARNWQLRQELDREKLSKIICQYSNGTQAG